jgi:diguanylate cyclase (GGDEF)-like protein/PAS domain S-box-containing protein
MSDDVIEADIREAALEALLKRYPTALVAALAPDGFRVPMPEQVAVRAEQIIPVPDDRVTMLDLLIPGDMWTVVSVWERARTTGMAISTVHMLHEPERPLSLNFLDLTHKYGVWLGVLTEFDSSAANAPSTESGERLPRPLRPRTATMRKSYTGMVTSIDERVTRMLGWTANEMLGCRSTEFMHPDDHKRALASWMDLLSRKDTQRVRVRHRCKDGEWLWVEVENVYQAGANPEDVESVVVVTQVSDISDEMATHDALDQQAKLFRRLAESLPIGLMQMETSGSVVYANARFAGILGTPAAGTVDERLATVTPEDQEALQSAIALTMDEGCDQELEVEVLSPLAGRRRCAVSLIALSAQEGVPGAILCLADITDSARMREELRVKATFDELTGCHNRASTMAVLDRALNSSEAVAVIFVDLDQFKPVNDRLGHAAGDELLVVVSDRLKDLLRKDDVVGRIGGDEFLLVCPGLGRHDALAVAQRAAQALHDEVTLAAGTVRLTASVGVACGDSDTTGDRLVAHADAAMYMAKRRRDGQPVLHA